MAFVDLEDLYGIVEVIVFPNVYERCMQSVRVDNVVVVKGTINFKEDEQPKLMAEKIFDLSSTHETSISHELKICIPINLNEVEAISALKEVLAAHKGNTSVFIKINKTGKKFKAGRDLWVTPEASLKLELEEMGLILMEFPYQ
jgi:DNA polymerase-3 subunit alpha